MKKISAIVLSLLMTCAVLASCGDNDSSSKKDSDSKKQDTSSAAAADSKDEESKADSSAAESKADVQYGSLAKAYTDKLNAGEFKIDMTLSSDLTGEMPCVITSKGGNYFIKMTAMGLKAEVYIVDGKGYTIMPDADVYQVMDDVDLGDLGVNTFGLNDSYQYVETKEEDGLTLEVYKAVFTDDYDLSSENADDSTDSSKNEYTVETTVTYYFDSNGDLKKIVSNDDFSGETTATVNSAEWTAEDITLPDLSGLTEMTDDSELSDEASMKIMLSMFGVTEDMLKEAGYTYDDLLALEDDELMGVLADLGVDLSSIVGNIE